MISSERHSGQGIHNFLGQLESGVDTFTGLERITLLGVDRDRMVHLLKFLLSIPVSLFLTIRRLFACMGELPTEPPHP